MNFVISYDKNADVGKIDEDKIIKYDKEKAAAPVLIAKGADHLAQKLKDIAKVHNVPIVENKPLARMLYYNVDIDAEIPQELYQMTAEVLAYVYQLKNKN